MKKEEKIQANYRLPKSLLSDLKSVAEETGENQTTIVRESLQTKVQSLQRKIQKRKEKEQETATI